MSWIITFAIFLGLCLAMLYLVFFIEGIVDLGYGLKTWKAKLAFATGIVLFTVTIWLLHHAIITRHLFGC